MNMSQLTDFITMNPTIGVCFNERPAGCTERDSILVEPAGDDCYNVTGYAIDIMEGLKNERLA